MIKWKIFTVFLYINFLVLGFSGISIGLTIDLYEVDIEEFDYEDDEYEIEIKGRTDLNPNSDIANAKYIKWKFDFIGEYDDDDEDEGDDDEDDDDDDSVWSTRYTIVIEDAKNLKGKVHVTDFDIEKTATNQWEFKAYFAEFNEEIIQQALGFYPEFVEGQLTRNSALQGALKLGTNSNPVPEPATMLLLSTGLICLAGIGRKRLNMKK